MVAAPKSSSLDAAAVAAVLADTISSRNEEHDVGPLNDCDESAVPHQSNPSTMQGDWREEVIDRPLRQAMVKQMMKLLTTSRLYRSSAQWRWKLPSLLRLIEAAHYRASPSRQAYLDTSNLKDRVKALAVAFHSEMRKHGKRTFYVAKQGGTQRVGDSIMKRSVLSTTSLACSCYLFVETSLGEGRRQERLLRSHVELLLAVGGCDKSKSFK